MAKVRLTVEFENGVPEDLDPVKDPLGYAKKVEETQKAFADVKSNLEVIASTTKTALPIAVVTLDELGEPVKAY